MWEEVVALKKISNDQSSHIEEMEHSNKYQETIGHRNEEIRVLKEMKKKLENKIKLKDKVIKDMTSKLV